MGNPGLTGLDLLAALIHPSSFYMLFNRFPPAVHLSPLQEQGAKLEEVDIPEDMQELAAEYREKLVEQVGARNVHQLFSCYRGWWSRWEQHTRSAGAVGQQRQRARAGGVASSRCIVIRLRASQSRWSSNQGMPQRAASALHVGLLDHCCTRVHAAAASCC